MCRYGGEQWVKRARGDGYNHEKRLNFNTMAATGTGVEMFPQDREKIIAYNKPSM